MPAPRLWLRSNGSEIKWLKSELFAIKQNLHVKDEGISITDHNVKIVTFAYSQLPFAKSFRFLFCQHHYSSSELDRLTIYLHECIVIMNVVFHHMWNIPSMAIHLPFHNFSKRVSGSFCLMLMT